MYGLRDATETKRRVTGGMSKDDDSTDDDGALFRRHLSDVRPLKRSGRVAPKSAKPAPLPIKRMEDERRVLEELLDTPADLAEAETGEELSFLRPGLQQRYLNRLRRGHYSIGDSLDLHQMNAETARDAILRFLRDAQESGLGCVRIVHGKGLRSKRGPVLKVLTRRLLSRHPAVAAFASCRPVDGGTGAVSVLLRRGTKAPR